MRDHQPIVIETFNGFWARGEFASCPPDHFPDCNNVAFAESSVQTRDGLGVYRDLEMRRLYEFVVPDKGNGFIGLDSQGQFWHIIPTDATLDEVGTITLILYVPQATDFFMLNWDNRAYINPIRTAQSLDDHLYVYMGDQTVARPAGGAHPTAADGNLTASPGGAGNVEAGIHIFNAVYETDTGFLTAPGEAFAQVQVDGTTSVDLTNIPVSPNPYVKYVWITATKAIDPTLFTGNVKGYEPFFVPGVRLPNGTTSTTVNFYDAELLTSADNLYDLMDVIPNGTGPLGQYHGRMTMVGNSTSTPNDLTGDPGIVWVSNPGEPEAFNKVSGFLTVPHDGKGISQAFEYRDILYVTKVTAMYAFSDNGGDPVDWPQTTLEGGIGCVAHGLGTVRQNDSLNIESMLLLNHNGLFNFQGLFIRPGGELSYKIQDFIVGSPADNPWHDWDDYHVTYEYQILNDVLNQLIYISLPDLYMILVGDYKMGMDPKSIRWTKWTFGVQPSTIAFYGENNLLVIGSQGSSVTNTPYAGGLYKIIYNGGKRADTYFLSDFTAETRDDAIPTPFFLTAFVSV